MNQDFWNEVFTHITQTNNLRVSVLTEYRLYYDVEGNVTAFAESNHPPGNNYIVLENPEIFYNNNSLLLRVKDKKLMILNPLKPHLVRLKKSTTGFKTVKGNAGIVLEENESYLEIDYYDRTNN